MFPTDFEKYREWIESDVNCPPKWKQRSWRDERIVGWELYPKEKLKNQGIPVPYDEYPDHCPLCNCRAKDVLFSVHCSNPDCENWDGKRHEVEYGVEEIIVEDE